MGNSLGHYPNNEHWEFDESVVKVFDDMLDRSIPSHQLMRQLAHKIGAKKLGNGRLLDLGCSRGEAILPFLTSNPHAVYHGFEISEPMVESAKERFKDFPNVFIHHQDITKSFSGEFEVIQSILTLQFIPIEYRQQILKDVYDNLEDGGMFIFVEKVIGDGAEIAKTFIDEYHAFKHRNGYTYDEIETKRKSLEKAMVPLKPKWNEELLQQAGFKEIDVFYRHLNFMGWVCIK